MLLENLFAGLLRNSNVFCAAYPHLKKEYFQDKCLKNIYNTIKDYYITYEKIPSFVDLKLLVDTDEKLTIEDTEATKEKINEISKITELPEEELLIKQIEKYVQNKALEIAILESVDILEKGKPRNEIHQKITDALAIEFNIKLGQDYFVDAATRLKYYLEVKEKMPLDIDVLNIALGGGLERKSLYIIMASTNVGKTTTLCHCASALMQNYNTLYVSAEMSENQILMRNDANLLGIPIEEFNPSLNKSQYKLKIKQLFNQTKGKLIVKEYPTGSASALTVRNLVHELKVKRGFIPDVIVLDGLNNFASYKIPASQTGTALYVKSVAEEMRALTNVLNIAMLSVTQFNRGAKAKKTDADLEDVGEAYAISQTADWACSLLQTDELREAGKYLIKVLKTRFGKNKGSIYTMGIDYDFMKLYNLKEDEQVLPLHIQDQLNYQKKMEDRQEENLIFDMS